MSTRLAVLFFLGLAAAAAQPVTPPLPPSPLAGLPPEVDFFPGADHDPAVPAPADVIGDHWLRRAATVDEIHRCLEAWTRTSSRVRVVEYARSHGGRPLHLVVVSDSANLGRLDAIRAGHARLADPRGLAPAEAAALIEQLPGIAWLGYAIHGDETEGSDAALALLHHLAAARDEVTTTLLRENVVIIDPVQNPDGRDRFLRMLADARGRNPNVDDQSLLHTGRWPAGRGNHYLADLNRDWIFGVHPETRGRWAAIAAWNPQLFVDVHGMGPQDTYLFSPPREPVNPHFPPRLQHWQAVFGRDQARAFDAQGWLYYTGEWNENWYPGYSDSWPAFRGGVGILYEQARTAEDAVRLPDGSLRSYREAVHGHVVGSLANLDTFRRHARDLRRDFYESRRRALDPEGPFGRRTWVVAPGTNPGRLRTLATNLAAQGLEVHVLPRSVTAATAIDQLGRTQEKVALPPGSLVIRNRQPLGHLAAMLLDFDPRLRAEDLRLEREELLRRGQSRIYDITAWNLTMLYGLEAWTLPVDIPAAELPPWQPSAPALPPATDPVAWVLDGGDDASVVAAARLLERGVGVRLARRAFALEGRAWARGSIVVHRRDNRLAAGDWTGVVTETAAALGVTAVPVGSSWGEGDLPDLGGDWFVRLMAPRVALLGQGRTAATDYGAVWHLLDRVLALRHSHLSEDAADGAALERYNVIVLPDRHGPLPPALVPALKNWVDAGGTLIALEGAAGRLAAEKDGLGAVRRLPDALAGIDAVEQQVHREWLGAHGPAPDATAVWSGPVAAPITYPWPQDEEKRPDEKELRRRDAWQQVFMPQGAIVATRVDLDHWLTAGCGALLPVLAGDQPVLLSGPGAEAPVRLGVFEPAASGATAAAVTRLGWSTLPAGQQLRLRLSGLLWPEAAHRLANSAYVTREAMGRGQVILFAGSPAFRGGLLGPQRLLLNAIVYGPGAGTPPRVMP